MLLANKRTNGGENTTPLKVMKVIIKTLEISGII